MGAGDNGMEYSGPGWRGGQSWKARLARLLIVLAGVVVGQFVLYGPSIIGKKVLLPLDILAPSSIYMPPSPATSHIVPQNVILADLVDQWEPARQFAVSEFRAGRLPMWMPYQYAGAPVVWPKFSPFLLLESTMASPIILAWTQLLAAMVAGLGAYLFFRRALKVSFWAAAVPAWCFPLISYFIYWQGFPTCAPVFWLPWILLAVDSSIRRTSAAGIAALAVVTGFILVSGALDVGGQVLLVSGLYAVWCLWDTYRAHLLGAGIGRAIASLVLGWALGFCLATPYILPLMQYAHTGARMQARAAGSEERPPEGLSALAPVLLPDIYGSDQRGSYRWGNQTQIESSSVAFTGILATLFVAPLAWYRRRYRSSALFWSLMVLLGLSWCLDVPGFVQILRLPGLNMMSHNRLVFAASFAILALAAIGLDGLLETALRPRWWAWIPEGVLILTFGWCAWHVFRLPEPIATQIGNLLKTAHPSNAIQSAEDVQAVRNWFRRDYAISALFAACGIAAWLILWRRTKFPAWAAVCVSICMVAELLWNASTRNPQCDWNLYYPRLPILQALAHAPPGRMLACGYLPAALAQTHQLHDIRGYDAIDPARLMNLMAEAADPHSPVFNYCMTQWYLPKFKMAPPDQVLLPPILDLLNVRYVIFRGTPPPGIQPVLHHSIYWVLYNPRALPRAFVPRHVESVPDSAIRLEKMASANFDPAETCYTEQPLNLPANIVGEAALRAELPAKLAVSVKMQTAGLVVLSDLWDIGWKAYLNGNPVPIYRVDHAIRGVLVPPGDGTLIFEYDPDRFQWGLRLAAGAGIVILALTLISARSASAQPTA
ncbi:MAG TPA: hypothetical protein VHY22_15105 [Chthoniobacteraceae bacterium]|jgi:hypothetical protein|nr:hypothetical protein [Chthoniobacteraceae bacterium]